LCSLAPLLSSLSPSSMLPSPRSSMHHVGRWVWKLASYMSAPPTSTTACSFCCRGVDKRLVREYGSNERARAHGQRVWKR
jgi:hypothetical protein